jgi:hypothetical protein
MEEERARKLAIAQAKAKANQPTYYEKDVGFIEGLLGKTSIEEQHRLMGNRYPAPKLSLWDGIKQDLSTAWNNDNSAFKAEQWADQAVRAQEGKHAANAMAAKYNAQNNFGDEDANFDANWRYGGEAAAYDDGNMMPGGPTSTTFVPDETEGVINTTKNAAGWLKKYFGDLDSPTKGVCTLPGGTTTQQLDRAACDAAGGTFNSPQLIYDAALKKGEGSGLTWDNVLNSGFVGGVNVLGQQLGHIKDAMADAQINDNKMQKAGLDWTPDKIAWIEKYGINNLPGTQRDDTGGDTKATAVGRDTPGYIQEGLLSPSQLKDRYPKRYEENAEANQGIFNAALKAAEGRDVTGTVPSDLAPISFMEEQKARAAALQQGTDARFDRRMGDDRMAAASVWADRAIDEQEAGQWANQQIDAQEASQAAAKAERMAAIQAGIDADAGRTTQENYELAAGITPNSLLDGVTEAMESNEEFATEKAETIQGWIAGAKEGIITWGSIAIDKVLDVIKGDGDALTETEANNVITEVENLAEQSSIEAATEVKQQDGLLVDPAKTNTDGLLVDSTKTTTSAVSDNIFTTTTPASTEGFTMDRLKNPLSAENKAWWLEKRPGDIPGNNRAVEFFNTLAYIGTPLKYRPAQTPSESLQDRKIKHMNNLMDYKAASSTSDPTFSALRAAVPSYNEIKDVITPRLTEAFDFGWFGKSDEEENSLEGQITATAAEIRARMIAMAMAGQTSTIEAEMAKLIKEAKEAEEARKAAVAAKKAAEAAAKAASGDGEPGIVDKAMTVFKGFF